jgi:hypothetical protein
MNPTLLAQLSPDRAPPPLGWWPLAPGWWALVALLLLGLALAVWLRQRARQPSIKRWQRAALRELAQLQRAARQTGSDDAQLAREIQQLLRRYAVARHGRETVASLSGDAWLAFVVRHGGRDWAGDSGQALLRCAYGGPAATRDRAVSSVDRERWLSGARAFIQSKRVTR